MHFKSTAVGAALFSICMFLAGQANAATTSSVTIGQMASRTDSAYTRVAIAGNTIDLGCGGSNAFVLLDQMEATNPLRYQTIFSMIMSAKLSEASMVFVTDGCASFNGSTYAVLQVAYF